MSRTMPLAARMRPRTLDEYIGQEHIVGKGRLLRRAIQADRLSSVIFYGPPGTGKTTLARVIAHHTKSNFLSLNAVLTGVPHIREAVASAEQNKQLYGRTTMLFVDEVHRWNRAQQDALLPWVENGTVIFIGATTENPFFEVNKALVSRSRVFQLHTLTAAELHTAAERCIQDRERGYGQWNVQFAADALEHLVTAAAGDARSLLNALELAVETSVEHWPPPLGTDIYINRAAAEESIQQKVVLYDRDGDYHYDVISAFIKSIRGSDPDAVLYWLARMLSAGESPHFIFRRLLISACEDIGLADPHALTVVTSAADAFDRVGLPEGRYHLIHAALYLATCPKSNSALGFFDALQAVQKENTEVPNHLKDANRDGAALGHGAGYLYPHAYRDHWVPQQYLPDEFSGTVFYTPSDSGYEALIKNDVFAKREAQTAVLYQHGEDVHIQDKGEELWQKRSEETACGLLETIRRTLIEKAHIKPEDRVLVYRADDGLLLWTVQRLTTAGTMPHCTAANTAVGCIAGIYRSPEALHAAERYAHSFDELARPFFALLPETAARSELSGMSATDDTRTPLFPDLAFDVILSYNPAATLHQFNTFFACIRAEHTDGGTITIAFPLPQTGLKLSHILHNTANDREASALPEVTSATPAAGTSGTDNIDTPPLAAIFEQAEQAFFSDPANARFAWDGNDVRTAAESAGFTVEAAEQAVYCEKRLITEKELKRWFSPSSEYGHFIRNFFTERLHSDANHANAKRHAEQVLAELHSQLACCCSAPVSFTRSIMYMTLKRH
ncbi:MAG: AAA family ATPase [Treponema sp.]